MADKIDSRKPIHLDFFTKLLEIHFPGVQLEAIIFYQEGGPELKGAFTKPEVAYSIPNIPKVNPAFKFIPVPVFKKIFTPPLTVNASLNQTIPAHGSANEHEITGDAVSPSQVTGFIDYRGYTTLNQFGFVKVAGAFGSFSWGPTAKPIKTVFYNKKGEKISKVPKPSKITLDRGLRIAEDDAGRIYMNIARGLNKWSKAGKMLFQKGGDTAVYDAANNEIKVLFTDSDTPGAMGDIKTFDLSGRLIRTKTVTDPDGGGSDTFSRGGKLYAFVGPTEDTWLSIRGYGLDGQTLWTIPGEAFDGFRYGPLCPYGEDYLVVGITRNDGGHTILIPGGTQSTTTLTNGYRIYKNGRKINEVILGPRIDVISQTTTSDAVDHTKLDVENYAGIAGMFKSEYWP